MTDPLQALPLPVPAARFPPPAPVQQHSFLFLVHTLKKCRASKGPAFFALFQTSSKLYLPFYKNLYIFVKGRKNGFLGKFPVFFVLCCKFVKHMLNLPLTGEGESNIQKVYFFVPRFTKGNALDREVEA